MSTLTLNDLHAPRKIPLVPILIVLTLCLLWMASADAGTTGEEFRELYERAMGWTRGYLGKVIAAFAFLIGCGTAAARQSLLPALFGLVLALVIGFAPELQESILTATV